MLLLASSAASSGRLDTTIGDYVRSHSFDGTVLVTRGGKRLYQKSFGLADRTLGARTKDGTRFRIASITKAFTAVLVLKLVEEGRINLDDPIRTYLPSFPGEGGDRITIRELLNHTSGLPNPDAEVKGYDEAGRLGMDQYQRTMTVDELVARFCRGPLRSVPGTTFDYNNADYIVLGKIVEATSGKPFEVALRERLLEPLGMRDTGLLVGRRLVTGLAPTYYLPDGAKEFELELPMYGENWYAAGSMYSTAPDLSRFFGALFAGKLLRQEMLSAMLKPGLDDYGFGMWVFPFEIGGKKLTAVQRPGLIMGANVVMLHVMEKDLTIVILSNTNGTDVPEFAQKIAKSSA